MRNTPLHQINALLFGGSLICQIFRDSLRNSVTPATADALTEFVLEPTFAEISSYYLISIDGALCWSAIYVFSVISMIMVTAVGSSAEIVR